MGHLKTMNNVINFPFSEFYILTKTMSSVMAHELRASRLNRRNDMAGVLVFVGVATATSCRKTFTSWWDAVSHIPPCESQRKLESTLASLQQLVEALL
jgi:hypothetical protein